MHPNHCLLVSGLPIPIGFPFDLACPVLACITLFYWSPLYNQLVEFHSNRFQWAATAVGGGVIIRYILAELIKKVWRGTPLSRSHVSSMTMVGGRTLLMFQT